MNTGTAEAGQPLVNPLARFRKRSPERLQSLRGHAAGVRGGTEARRDEGDGSNATVFERSYAKLFDDHQDMEQTRRRLAAIGFGVSGVD